MEDKLEYQNSPKYTTFSAGAARVWGINEDELQHEFRERIEDEVSLCAPQFVSCLGKTCERCSNPATHAEPSPWLRACGCPECVREHAPFSWYCQDCCIQNF